MKNFVKRGIAVAAFAMLPAGAAGLLSVSVAQAAVTYSGNLNPTTNPSTWTTSTSARVGDSADGNLTIDGGSAVTSSYSYLGYNAGITGTATVTGSGSKWTTTYFNASRYVGYSGIGVLNITNGGYVNNKTAYIGYNTGSTGTVTVDGPGSTWSNSAINVGQNGTGTLNIFNGSTVSATGATTVGTAGVINFGTSGGTLTTGSICASTSQISGVGTINTSGIVSDVALVFDGSHGASQALSFNSVAVNLSQSSSGALGAGYLGSGSLTIAGGVSVASNGGYLGYQSGSTGTATVTGTGSTWNGGNGNLSVGNSGTGSLSITNGAAVSNSTGYIGANSGATGSVTVDGAGSKWTNSGSGLHVGSSGTGSLSITNGAAVSSAAGYLGNASGSTGVATVDGAGSKWTNSSNFYVGNNGTGTLNITNGATVSDTTGYIAGNTGSKGTVTIDGAGSMWTSSGGLFIGNSGAGTLNISNGGAAIVTGGNANVGMLGTINFGTNGGTLTMSGTFYGSPSQMTGTGSITAAGLVSDIDRVFDATHGLNQSFTQNGITFNVNQGSVNGLGVGYIGSASLAISGGINVVSSTGYLGYNAGSTGTATVTGTNSKWTINNNNLMVGNNGAGSLSITGGAAVSSAMVFLGYGSGSTGVATVNGPGSSWTNSSTLYVGSYGVGTLSIGDGGLVTASDVNVRTGSSILAVDVGRNSSLTVGNGTGSITNSGTIRMVAGAGAANGTYTPIQAGSWTNTGTIQALGGKLNSDHSVTVNSAITALAGEVANMDLYTNQRGLVTDPVTGKSVGLGFQAAAGSTPITFTAKAISGAELSSLRGQAGAGESVLSGWNFSVTGYATGNPVYLSLFAGSDTSLSDLTVWKYSSSTSTWASLSPADLAYDGTYASFTVSDLSDYAITGTSTPTPIPAAAWLLGSGLMGLAGMRRKQNKQVA